METFYSSNRALFKPLYRNGGKKKYPKTLNQPRYSDSRPPKMTGLINLIREVAKRPVVTVEELQSFTAKVGEFIDKTTVSGEPHRSDPS